jgi:succinate dehydrogenase subunit C
MAQSHPATPYHPRWLRQPLSTYWWLQKRSYFWFILRELSSVFVAWFVVFLLMLIRAVSSGAEAYGQFLTWAGTWPVVLLNVVTLGFIVFHMITFFVAAPQALVVHLGRQRVPGSVVAGAHYAAMLAASLVVVWVLLGP